MKFIIIGSGGCVSTPRPLCKCRVCKQAREMGYPYARCGCSMYVEDINTLIDTPEDITHALNNCHIDEVDYILYSHMDPDHTMGMRVVEQLKLDWLGMSKHIKFENPIKVFALPNVLDDINSIMTKRGGIMDYYESLNLIKRISIDQDIIVRAVKVTFVPANPNGDVTIFVFQKNKKKLIYAPCDVKPFPENKLFKNADYLVIGNTVIGTVLKDGFILEKDNPLNDELFSMDEIVEIQKKYNIKNVVVTHLEEDYGKTYDDYINIEKQYENIKFAYDGMVIEM